MPSTSTYNAPRLLMVVAALSVAVFLASLGTSLGKQHTSPRAPIANAPAQLDETDGDADGVPDWQEALIGTDPAAADSDNDGNPDVFDPQKSDVALAAEKTAADVAAERLLSQYVALKKVGAYTPERGKQIGEQVALSMRATVAFEPYTISSLNIVPAHSENAALFKKQLNDSLSPFLELENAEITLFGKYIDTRNEYFLEELGQRAEVYEAVAARMLTLSVPEDVATTHLEVVNGLAYFAAVLKDMSRFGRDPVAALALLRAYNDAERYVGTTFANISSYLSKQL